jgi:hypothetical protein
VPLVASEVVYPMRRVKIGVSSELVQAVWNSNSQPGDGGSCVRMEPGRYDAIAFSCASVTCFCAEESFFAWGGRVAGSAVCDCVQTAGTGRA